MSFETNLNLKQSSKEIVNYQHNISDDLESKQELHDLVQNFDSNNHKTWRLVENSLHDLNKMIFDDSLDSDLKLSLQSDIDLIFRILSNQQIISLKKHYFFNNDNNYFIQKDSQITKTDESNKIVDDAILEQAIANLGQQSQFLKSLIENKKLTNDERLLLKKRFKTRKNGRVIGKNTGFEHHSSKRMKILTHQEQCDLALRIQAGDEAAKDIMIKANLPLVMYFARKYVDRGLELDDLASEGIFGLIKAVEKFDPNKGYRFSSYAKNWINNSLKRAVLQQAQAIRKPEYWHLRLDNYFQYRLSLQEKLKREPSLEEIAQAMKMEVEEVEEIINVHQNTSDILSLNAPLKDGTEDLYFIDSLTDKNFLSPEEEIFQTIDRDNINSIIDNMLSPKEAAVIRMRFGFFDDKVYSLEHISQQLNVAYKQIRRIQKTAMAKINLYLSDSSN